MKAYGKCETGAHRLENQDTILMRSNEKSGLWVVADGVGGLSDGADASQMVTQAYANWWDEAFLPNQHQRFTVLFEGIKEAAEKVNQDICQKYGTGKSGSTIVLVFLHKGMMGCLSAGDSRIYRCNRYGARCITRDDVWQNDSTATADTVSNAHEGKIISAIGGYTRLSYSCITDRVRYGEAIMLCSDGIHKFVAEDFLLKQLKKTYRCLFLTQKMVETIVGEAVRGDTQDNYSIILIKVH